MMPRLDSPIEAFGTETRPPIKTFGGEALGINSHRYVLIPCQFAAGHSSRKSLDKISVAKR
jgi:hypothetical protein